MTSRTDALPGAAARLRAAVAVGAERRRVADFLTLTKPRVVLMVLVTTFVGYYLGSAGGPDYLRLAHKIGRAHV